MALRRIAALASLALALPACALTGSPPEATIAPPSFAVAAATVVASEPQRNIRSGRHVDLAAHDDGIVVATFRRPTEGGAMQPWVEQRAPTGERRWGLTLATAGRASSITRTANGDTWVTGWAEGIEEGVGMRPFLTRLDPTGATVVTRLGPATALPFLVRAAADGSLLVAGESRGTLEWDGQRLADGGSGSWFLGRFDAAGRCLELIAVRGRAVITQAAAAPDGGFVVGGQFNGPLEVGGHRLDTTGPLDADGFILRVGATGSVEWARAIGRPGNPLPHHRSREAVWDLLVAADGGIVAAVLEDDPEAQTDDLVVAHYTRHGNRTGHQRLAVDVRPPGSIALARGGGDGFLLAYAQRPRRAGGDDDGAGEAREIVLEERTGDGRVLRRHAQTSAINGMFRSALGTDGELWLAGHFQHGFAWGEQTLDNEGFHQIVLVRQPLR